MQYKIPAPYDPETTELKRLHVYIKNKTTGQLIQKQSICVKDDADEIVLRPLDELEVFMCSKFVDKELVEADLDTDEEEDIREGEALKKDYELLTKLMKDKNKEIERLETIVNNYRKTTHENAGRIMFGYGSGLGG